jgi:hypothetical protein
VDAEAELIRIIFDMYLNGHSSPQIANILTRSGIPTATNKEIWTGGAVLGILRNEKYCGDVLCQKTMTLDVFTHKAVKNKGQKKQYFIEGHHEAIIDKKDWLLVQKLLQEKYYCKNRRRKRPRIMVKGCLSGFTLIDLNWDDDDIVSVFMSPQSADTASETTNFEIIDI